MPKATVSANYFVNERVIARVKTKLAQAAKVKAHDVQVGINNNTGHKKIIVYTGEEGAAEVWLVALAHEFGTDVLPERSWFRSWFDRNAERMRKEMAAAMQQERKGNTNAVPKLARKWRDELRDWIRDDAAHLAPLAERTQRQRTQMGLSASPPLYAIGQLVDAIRATVDGVEAAS